MQVAMIPQSSAKLRLKGLGLMSVSSKKREAEGPAVSGAGAAEHTRRLLLTFAAVRMTRVEGV